MFLESSKKKLRDTSELAKVLEAEGLKGMEKRSTLLAYFQETAKAKIEGVMYVNFSSLCYVMLMYH